MGICRKYISIQIYIYIYKNFFTLHISVHVRIYIYIQRDRERERERERERILMEATTKMGWGLLGEGTGAEEREPAGNPGLPRHPHGRRRHDLRQGRPEAGMSERPVRAESYNIYIYMYICTYVYRDLYL